MPVFAPTLPSAQLASDAHADAKAHAAAHTGSVAPAVAAADAVAVVGAVAQGRRQRPSMHWTERVAGTRKSDAAAVAEAYAEAYSSAYVDADDAGPDADTDGRHITSSVMLQGIVAVVFNADKGMQMAFAQSIIDSVGGLFEEIIDMGATERRRLEHVLDVQHDGIRRQWRPA